MSLAFSAATAERVREAIRQSLDKQAALLPVLSLAQEEFGALSREALQLVAATLGLPYQHVESTATFYSMFTRVPRGRYHIQVCRTLSCAMLGAPSLLQHLEEKLGVKPGEVTSDGKFSFEGVECLALCGDGPAAQINQTNYVHLTIEKLDALLASLE